MAFLRSSRLYSVALLLGLCSTLLPCASAQDTTDAPSLAPSTPAPTAEGWGGCVDPVAGFKKVTIGESTTLCLQLGNGDDWSAGVDYIRLTFQPTADDYTRFFVPQSYADLVGNPASDSIWFGKNITLGVASQDSLSFLRRYFDSSLERVYPYLTAIVDVKDGIVLGITWDDACIFCSGECPENTVDFNGVEATQKTSGQPTKGCYILQTTCNEFISKDDRTDCDLIIYVVWTGTDSDGKTFQSAANRFSNFEPQELQDSLASNLPQVNRDFARREL